jgi:hypothetical protein
MGYNIAYGNVPLAIKKTKELSKVCINNIVYNLNTSVNVKIAGEE